MKKGEKHLKLCNSDCVDPLCFRYMGRITCHMALTDDLCEFHKIHNGISLGINYTNYAVGSEWSEHNK